MSAQNPYAVTPERRTDSKPFRRRFVRKNGFGSCRRKFIQKYFRQSFESRSQDGVPRAFYVTFCTMQKVTIRSLRREFRGSANLESAHPNNNFPLTKLNPFAASRFLSPPCGGYLPTFCRTQKVGQKSLCPFRGSTPCVHSKNYKGDYHGKKYPRL